MLRCRCVRKTTIYRRSEFLKPERQRTAASIRANLARPARIGRELPASARLVVSKDVRMPVIGVNFEPALRWRKPAVDDCTYGKPPITQPKSERLLFAAIAGIAFHADRHALRIPPKCTSDHVRA